MAILLGLCGATRLLAGVYSTAETDLLAPVVGQDGKVTPLPTSLLLDTLNERFGIWALQQALDQQVPPDPNVSSQVKRKRQEYQERAAALQTQVRTGQATLEDRVNLAAYLIWLGKYAEVIELLEPVARGEGRDHFPLLANLGTAYQLLEQLERAANYLEQARAVWPREWPGWTPAQLAWFAEVEGYQLRLVRTRRLEAARAPPGARLTAESVDSLFGERDDPVRYVGESGRYEAGALAARERAKLPANALAIVQQLVLWMPADTRLYWQLGELLNAQGQEYVRDAYQVLDACVYVRNWHARELREHRQVLMESLARAPETGTEADSWVPATSKLWLVGGIAVVMMIVLGYFQVQELRRRRRG